jgi:hypothetical protein
VYEVTEGQVIKAKQHYYSYGCLQALAVKKYNARIFDYDIISAGNVLLSDNQKLISEFATLRYTAGSNAEKSMEQMVAEGESSIWCHTIFMFILDNKELIERNLELIDTVALNKSSSPRESMQPDLDFFRALNNGDVKGMEKALTKLLSAKLHKKRNPGVVFAQHISQIALTYTKLAWYKGFEVVVNNPLVPAGMLPVKPLDTYDTYDFLKTMSIDQ